MKIQIKTNYPITINYKLKNDDETKTLKTSLESRYYDVLLNLDDANDLLAENLFDKINSLICEHENIDFAEFNRDQLESVEVLTEGDTCHE